LLASTRWTKRAPRSVFYRRIIEDRNTQQDNDIEEVPTEVISERVVKRAFTERMPKKNQPLGES
jgi:hypothetical protein